MLIDSHAHIASDALYPQIDDILMRAREAGLDKIVNICTDLTTLERGLEIRKKHPWVYLAGATTPHDVEEEGEQFFDHFEKAAFNNELVAVGETGLDYHYEHSPKKLQQEFFIRYMDLALRAQLPIIIHCRDAFTDFFSMIDQYYPSSRGVLHCFTGTLLDAKELIKRGWLISLSGIITFKKSVELQEVARYVPLEHLLIETDSPYLAPQSKRGKVNEPAFLAEIATKVAYLKQTSLEQVLKATSQNAVQLFKLHE